MHDVARSAGVSVKTVSNVINDYPHVRPTTRDRVLRAIDELGYRPNVAARGLRSGRTGVIGLAVPALRENYFAELCDSMIRVAESRGLGVVVEQTDGTREAELLVLSRSRLRIVDGLVLSPIAIGQDDIAGFDTEFPLVLIGERIFGGPTDHVAMHNRSAARAAVEHLISRGRRRIALIGSGLDEADVVSSGGLRLRGYLDALAAAGIAVDPALIRPSRRWNREAGATLTRLLVRDGVAFDAVFALNDTLALGALRGVGEAGLAIPRDVAIMGFDDIDESQYSVPSLSTVDVGKERIAELAIDCLIERLDEKSRPRATPRTMKPDFRIVERESTAL